MADKNIGGNSKIKFVWKRRNEPPIISKWNVIGIAQQDKSSKKSQSRSRATISNSEDDGSHRHQRKREKERNCSSSDESPAENRNRRHSLRKKKRRGRGKSKNKLGRRRSRSRSEYSRTPSYASSSTFSSHSRTTTSLRPTAKSKSNTGKGNNDNDEDPKEVIRKCLMELKTIDPDFKKAILKEMYEEYCKESLPQPSNQLTTLMEPSGPIIPLPPTVTMPPAILQTNPFTPRASTSFLPLQIYQHTSPFILTPPPPPPPTITRVMTKLKSVKMRQQELCSSSLKPDASLKMVNYAAEQICLDENEIVMDDCSNDMEDGGDDCDVGEHFVGNNDYSDSLKEMEMEESEELQTMSPVDIMVGPVFTFVVHNSTPGRSKLARYAEHLAARNEAQSAEERTAAKIGGMAEEAERIRKLEQKKELKLGGAMMRKQLYQIKMRKLNFHWKQNAQETNSNSNSNTCSNSSTATEENNGTVGMLDEEDEEEREEEQAEVEEECLNSEQLQQQEAEVQQQMDERMFVEEEEGPRELLQQPPSPNTNNTTAGAAAGVDVEYAEAQPAEDIVKEQQEIVPAAEEQLKQVCPLPIVEWILLPVDNIPVPFNWQPKLDKIAREQAEKRHQKRTKKLAARRLDFEEQQQAMLKEGGEVIIEEMRKNAEAEEAETQNQRNLPDEEMEKGEIVKPNPAVVANVVEVEDAPVSCSRAGDDNEERMGHQTTAECDGNGDQQQQWQKDECMMDFELGEDFDEFGGFDFCNVDEGLLSKRMAFFSANDVQHGGDNGNGEGWRETEVNKEMEQLVEQRKENDGNNDDQGNNHLCGVPYSPSPAGGTGEETMEEGELREEEEENNSAGQPQNDESYLAASTCSAPPISVERNRTGTSAELIHLTTEDEDSSDEDGEGPVTPPRPTSQKSADLRKTFSQDSSDEDGGGPITPPRPTTQKSADLRKTFSNDFSDEDGPQPVTPPRPTTQKNVYPRKTFSQDSSSYEDGEGPITPPRPTTKKSVDLRKTFSQDSSDEDGPQPVTPPRPQRWVPLRKRAPSVFKSGEIELITID